MECREKSLEKDYKYVIRKFKLKKNANLSNIVVFSIQTNNKVSLF